jgi:hypothetical protein
MNEKATFSKVVVLIISMVFIVSAFGTMPASYIESKIEMEEKATEDVRTPTGTRALNDRVILAEMFTNTACSFCPDADKALNEIVDVFGPLKVVHIQYHTWWPDANDPFYIENTVDNTARINYYAVGSTPTATFSGLPLDVGSGGGPTGKYSDYETRINSELAIQSPITISLDGYYNSTAGSVTATINVTDTLPAGDLKIRFAVIEDNIYLPATYESRWRNVMRVMLTEDTLPNLVPGGQHIVQRNFSIESWWNKDNLGVVVFVQDDIDPNKEVLQAALYDYIPQKILLVDDDQSTNPEGYEDDWQNITCMGQYAFDTWVLNEVGSPTAADLAPYETVIWITGKSSSNTITSSEQTAIQTYLDTTGGSLFISGENIGFDLNGTSFYSDYLYATMGMENTKMPVITGIAMDPISNPYWGMDLLILDSSPSEIDPVNGGTSTFLYSGLLASAAVKAVHDSDSKVVYFGFMFFEAGESDNQKRSVLVSVLTWLNSEPTSIDLEEGYNLVSIPNIQIDPNLDSVFDSISGEYDAIQYYQANDFSDPWKHWKDTKMDHMNDLDIIENYMGFWIRVTTPGGTTFLCNGTQPSADEYVDLYVGWNMVGYPSMTTRDRNAALNNLVWNVDVDSVWTYDAVLDQWIELGPSDNFEPGRGYIIHSLFDNTWTVPK